MPMPYYKLHPFPAWHLRPTRPYPTPVIPTGNILFPICSENSRPGGELSEQIFPKRIVDQLLIHYPLCQVDDTLCLVVIRPSRKKINNEVWVCLNRAVRE